MGETTGVEWTDATVNFWWGCTKVGPGCLICYAEAFDKRVGGSHWGVGAPRRRIASAAALIKRLDNAHAGWATDYTFGQLPGSCGIRRRVFIQSMSDLFDTEVPLDWFAAAWTQIDLCNRIAIQIVTKRISVVEKRLAAIGRSTWPRHAGLIATVVNQEEADRDIPRLIALKKKFGIRWVGLSIEPMLGRIDLTPWLDEIDWVICGGESGPQARPMHLLWPLDIRNQCEAAGVAYFFKQWGEWAPYKPQPGGDLGAEVRSGRVVVVHPSGRPSEELFASTWRSAEPGSRYMKRVGKRAAGRMLAGRTHDAMPTAMWGAD
ncbi:Phage protein Gp37/Gp68 [bacterium YEK0313]|nr:Phage protein Gp37/Gp68 [bacterium YEK0313]